ncbi:nucleoside monophosphate kinase [Luteolibacter sp. LG18]|uniref:adenylate kinase family protein n=1 Tax=Luteolibacter sp. LG18 TaxID=2819286 RepID=UPI002B2B8C48|nr:adenylate kinase [Luteolibacter sp. LG18]
MPLRVVLLGPPASGKGTQGRRLAEAAGVAYLSTGALLREAVEELTPLGLQAKPILDRGGYLPDDLMCGILGEWLARHPDGWVLDGFPRSVPQAEFLERWLGDHDQALDRVIALDVPMEELLHRIQARVECPECRWSGQATQASGDRCPVCGSTVSRREDDDEENFRSRHAAYSRYTLPLVDFYDQRGLLSHQNATASADEVAGVIHRLFFPSAVSG